VIIDLADVSAMHMIETWSLMIKEAHVQTVALTSGCFDLTHVYHFKYFQRCKRECDILMVGVDSDKLVRSVKGPTRPIFNELQRIMMVDWCKFVDFTFIMNSLEDWDRMATITRPNKIFKNDVFESGCNNPTGAELVIIPDIEELTSTTAFIKRIMESGIESSS